MRRFFQITILFFTGCCAGMAQKPGIPEGIPFAEVNPRVITDTTKFDTDDPAIWINRKDPGKSLIIGTDKNSDGALYAFDLQGKIVKISGRLNRPNNVDIAYGFSFQGEETDVAVVTERMEQRIRVFRLPELEPIDQGDLIVFDGNPERAPMGIALYKRRKDQAFFVFVSGKSGPPEGYIAQYRLEESNPGKLTMTLIRQFGTFSGKREIESIAVDDELGYVYYSDEQAGIRKYDADPDMPGAGKELALFATQGFAGDHEGISIYKRDRKTGYILVSDQQANRFRIYPREGSRHNPHGHQLVKVIQVPAAESDGSDVTSCALPGFPAGLFVAMSNGKTFHYYDWQDIAGNDLKSVKTKK
jgi:3-phytase